MRTKDDEKRARILEAAAPLFATKRFHEVTLDEVAELAHISKGTVYTYFRDKEGLFAAVIADTMARHAAELRAVAEPPGTAAQRLSRVASRCLAHAEQHSVVMRLLDAAAVRAFAAPGGGFPPPGAEDMRDQFDAVISSILQVGQRNGEIRVGHPDQAAAMFFGMLRFAHLRSRPGTPTDAIAAAVVDLFLNGVAVRASSDPTATGR